MFKMWDKDSVKSVFSGLSLVDFQLFLLQLYAFSLPFKMVFSNGIAILILAVFFLQLYINGKSPSLPYLFYMLVAFYAIHLFGMLYTSNVKHGFFLLERRLSLLIFPCIVYIPKSFIKEIDVKKTLSAFVLGLTVSFWYSVVMVYFRHVKSSPNELSLNYLVKSLDTEIPMTHVYFGMYCVFSIAYSFYKLIVTKDLSRTDYICAFSSFLFLILFVPKTSLIALVIALFWLIIRFRSHINFRLGLGFVLLFLTLLSMMLMFPNSRQRLRQFTFGYSYQNMVNDGSNYSSLRTAPFFCSLELMQNNWLTGLGTGDVQDEMDNWYKDNKLTNMLLYDSHNQYFDIILAFGITGFLLLMSLFLVPMLASFGSGNAVYFLFLLIVSLAFMTENILNNNKGVMFYSFFNSLFASQFVKKA